MIQVPTSKVPKKTRPETRSSAAEHNTTFCMAAQQPYKSACARQAWESYVTGRQMPRFHLEFVHATPWATSAREIGAMGQEANLLFTGSQNSRPLDFIDQGINATWLYPSQPEWFHAGQGLSLSFQA